MTKRRVDPRTEILNIAICLETSPFPDRAPFAHRMWAVLSPQPPSVANLPSSIEPGALRAIQMQLALHARSGFPS